MVPPPNFAALLQGLGGAALFSPPAVGRGAARLPGFADKGVTQQPGTTTTSHSSSTSSSLYKSSTHTSSTRTSSTHTSSTYKSSVHSSTASYVVPSSHSSTFSSSVIRSSTSLTSSSPSSSTFLSSSPATFLSSTSSIFPSSSSSVFSSSASSIISISTSTPASVASASASSNSTSSSSSTSSASSAPTAAANGTCAGLIASLTFPGQNVTVTSCEDVNAGSSLSLAKGPSNCAASVVPEVGIRRLILNIVTSYASSDYVEVWLPTASNWNGRFMTTDNKGLSGCASYDDMTYTSSLGFAVVGDSGGHNSSEYLGFDGTQFLNNNEVVIDWSYRARHAAVTAAKQVIKAYYGQAQSYSYMLGCSNGGRQALQSAQMFPDDFDGIIAGSATTDFNHETDWSGRMYVLTGDSSSDRYLKYSDWQIVHQEVLRQCDEPLDGVADGILEDSTICDFNATKLTCVGNQTSNCLTFTQTSTVWNVFSQLYDQQGNLLYPRLAPGSELYSSTNGALHGIQGHVQDWIGSAVWNNSNWNPAGLVQIDYTEGDKTDVLHGNVSSNNGDLSAFRAAGKKLIMYHGLMDPSVSAEQSQRYYLHVAQTMGLGNADLDSFLRLFRISGMYHCTGGVGAWAFGQNIHARAASDSVITDIMNWVEKGEAPETMTGTKWVNDDPSNAVEIERAHCRFPYRNTYNGFGNPNVTSSWSCQYISNWQDCGVNVVPRLC